jgi:hypothetical protein
MRAFAERLLPFAVAGLAAVLSAQAAAQSDAAPAAPSNRLESTAVDALIANATGATEEADEITVKGQKDELARYRLKMTQSRDKLVETFNRVNSNDDNDVKCRTEKPTGSRLGHSVCRSKAEEDANANAAKGLLDSWLYNAGQFHAPRGPSGQPMATGGVQVNALAGGSKSTQEGAAGAYAARDQLEAEFKKLMEQNRQLYRAVVEYVEAKDDYNKARGAGDVVFDASHPRPE